jgi:hypothetical protein
VRSAPPCSGREEESRDLNLMKKRHEVTFSFNPAVNACGDACTKVSSQAFYEVTMLNHTTAIGKCPECGRCVICRPAPDLTVIQGGLCHEGGAEREGDSFE